jgi:hypothetical protein
MGARELRILGVVVGTVALALVVAAVRPVRAPEPPPKSADEIAAHDLVRTLQDLDRVRADVERTEAEKDASTKKFVDEETWRRVKQQRVVQIMAGAKGADAPETKKTMDDMYRFLRPQVEGEVALLERCAAAGVRLGGSREAIYEAAMRIVERYGFAGSSFGDAQVEGLMRRELELEKLKAKPAPR